MKQIVSRTVLICALIAAAIALILFFTPKPTTELLKLSFTNHTELPTELEAETPYELNITLENLGPTGTYTYTLSQSYLSTEEILFSEEQIIFTGETITRTESIVLTKGYGSAQIKVQFDEEEIYFWVQEP